jgi:hypothetical protein
MIKEKNDYFTFILSPINKKFFLSILLFLVILIII